MPKIKYSGTMRPISERARAVLEKILEVSGIPSATLTSTKRSAEDQARIMFDNLERTGVKAQHLLYGICGDMVIDVYEECKKAGLVADQIRQAMAEEIRKIGPEKISHHCSDDPDLDVFDVAPSSIPAEKKTLFEMHARDCSVIKKFITPPTDPAYHIEMRFGEPGEII